MSWRRNLAKFVALFCRPKAMDELAEEIRTHLQMEEQENLESGMSPADARDAARRRFGNVALAEQKSREMWVWNGVEALWQDLGFGLRKLIRSPGFTTVAMLTLALGIGANTAIFQLLDAVRLRSLPVTNPAELTLVHLADADLAGKRGSQETVYPALNNPLWEYIRDHQTAFSQVLAWSPTILGITEGDHERLVQALWVTGDFFNVLGVRPAL